MKRHIGNSKEVGREVGPNEIEEIDDGPGRTHVKPRQRKRKHLARQSEGKSGSKRESVLVKRLSNEIRWPSLGQKKSKVSSPSKMEITQHNFNSPQAKIKQNWETQGNDAMEISTITKNQAAEAGYQLRRQP